LADPIIVTFLGRVHGEGQYRLGFEAAAEVDIFREEIGEGWRHHRKANA
jgi:sRNA-binding carbon storage regulator CsrA